MATKHNQFLFSSYPSKICSFASSDYSSTMATKPIDKIGHLRRYSTGSSRSVLPSEPNSILIPNYLRASIGSCHDICKYGPKTNPKLQNKRRKPFLPMPDKNNMRNEVVVSSSTRISRKQLKEINPKPPGRNLKTTTLHEPAKKAPIHARESTRTSKKSSVKPVNLNTSSSSSSSSKSPLAKRRGGTSIPGRASGIKKRSPGNVPDKIIHAVEQKDIKQNEITERNMTIDLMEAVGVKQNGVAQGNVASDPTEVIEIEQIGVGERKTVASNLIEVVVGVEQNEDVEEKSVAYNRSDSNKGVRLMNAIIEETACKLSKMRKNKVESLVGAFERVIAIQDSKNSGTLF